MRVGQGYDIHRLEAGCRLIIGGVEIAHDRGVLAHSDGDVLVHAIIDALLGAMGQKDIGTFFPDTDTKYKGVDSLSLLSQTIELMGELEYKIENVDTTVILEEPKLAPYIDKMRSVLADALGVEQNRLSIKAKTNEGLGEIGKGEAIAAQAAVLLKKI